MIDFVIHLYPRTKKNSQQMLKNHKTGKLYPAPSKAFLKYQEAAGWYIPLKHGEISKKLNIKALFYIGTDELVDLVGLLQALDDILKYYGVIADDNYKIVARHDGSEVFIDRKNPRTEIEITDVAP